MAFKQVLFYFLHKLTLKVHYLAAAGAFYMYVLIAVAVIAYKPVNRFLSFLLGYFNTLFSALSLLRQR